MISHPFSNQLYETQIDASGQHQSENKVARKNRGETLAQSNYAKSRPLLHGSAFRPVSFRVVMETGDGHHIFRIRWN